jgi:hypothetical protein
MISISSGNGSKGVVGILLRPFLIFHEESVAKMCDLFQGFTKKFHEPIRLFREVDEERLFFQSGMSHEVVPNEICGKTWIEMKQASLRSVSEKRESLFFHLTHDLTASFKSQ